MTKGELLQMSDQIEVRVGTPDDLDRAMEWASLAAIDNALVDPDKHKLLQMFWPALNCQNGIMGIIGEPGKPFEGAILLTVGELWYSPSPVLEERVVFVNPEFRSAKGGRARKLCEFAKSAAKQLDLPLAIGILSNKRTAAKIRLYQRMFGEPVGVYFLYGGKTGLEKQITEGN